VLSSILFLSNFVFSQQKKEIKPDISMTLFFESMDNQGWQLFFISDAIKRRLPYIKLDIYPVIQKKDGNWSSPRGESEIKESLRIMAVKNKYPSKLLVYLSARSLSPYPEGWRDAMIFSEINPFEISEYIEKNKDKLLDSAYQVLQRKGIKQSSLLINGKTYDGETNILKILDFINNELPQNYKLNLYKEQMASIKAPDFKIIYSKKTENWIDENVINVFKRYFSNLNPKKVDYNKPEISKIFNQLKFLPAYAIEDNESTRENLSQPINSGVFEKIGNYYVFYNKQGKIMINNAKEEPKKLELYVMSQCPFGVMAENSIIDALNNSLIDKDIKIEIHYIADAIKNEKGELTFRSLHGEEEWKEDVRQLLINKNYPQKFFSYLLERNKNYQSSQWQDAALKAGIDPKEIEANFEKGKQLLAEDTKKSQELDINTSPTFIVNGNMIVVGLKELSQIDGYNKININSKNVGAGCSQ